MIEKKEVKTALLKRLEEKLAVVQKSKRYLEEETKKIKIAEAEIKEKIRRERKAISLITKAKKLR